MRRVAVGVIMLLAVLSVRGVAAAEGEANDVQERRRALAVEGMRALEDKGAESGHLAALLERLDAYEFVKKEAGRRGLADREAAATQPAAGVTLDEVKNAVDAADGKAASVELAQALHRERLYKRALAIYEAAYEKEEDEERRGWLLLMIGDCRAGEDALAASETYKRLAAEHPDSSWRSFALFRSKLLEWRVREPAVGELEEAE